MEPILPQRKHPRLSNYDYSSNGYYFITACTKDRRCVLSKIVGRGFPDAPEVVLSDRGKIVEQALFYLHEHNDHISLDKYVIMPNHIHLIVEVIESGGASGKPRPTPLDPTNAVIPQFMSSLKRFTNRQSGQTLWQTGFYDHVIRNEADYLRTWQYIDENPAKWEEDDYYTE